MVLLFNREGSKSGTPIDSNGLATMSQNSMSNKFDHYIQMASCVKTNETIFHCDSNEWQKDLVFQRPKRHAVTW
jgi:hypothetical protein